MPDYKIADIQLADFGRAEIQLAEAEMPALMALRERYRKEQPLAGAHILGCIHMSREFFSPLDDVRTCVAKTVSIHFDPHLRTRTGRARLAQLVQSAGPLIPWSRVRAPHRVLLSRKSRFFFHGGTVKENVVDTAPGALLLVRRDGGGPVRGEA